MSKFSRRFVLRAGGAAVALPLLDAFRPRAAQASRGTDNTFVVFVRQANGVACEQQTEELGSEPERFWPHETGTLTEASLAGRALDELTDHRQRLLVVRGVNMQDFPYGDGHARGALQGLTGRGPTVDGAGGNSEAAGESLDHRIGVELNGGGRESLFLYVGPNGGWLGGPCISYRSAGSRRAAIRDPLQAYMAIMGLDNDQYEELAERQASVNDLVRDQMNSLLSRPSLSQDDRQRLELHFESIRDLELGLSCRFEEDELMQLEGAAAGYESNDGDRVLEALRAHMDVAALAVACGHTRSVAIQVGDGNDGSIRYRDPDTGEMMENFHYISHRRQSHDANGGIIPGSDLLHHKIDRQFAQAFKHLIDRLAAYDLPNGSQLIDAGTAIWYNDLGNGPAHGPNSVPYIVAGSAGGYLRQGEYIDLPTADWTSNHTQMLNTIGAAAGVRNADGDPLDDFGDPGQPKGLLPELLA
ncbi:MAG: DUF1552 domain-containing protein [Myxococcales bacterium FL481]|nr:MAG: DUF1552 domain-containing protein [Myxococcales bacterium FL481]